MDLAKPGEIKAYCDPNACATFAEYIEDYATPKTKIEGHTFLKKAMETMEPAQRKTTEKLVSEIRNGKRDCYC